MKYNNYSIILEKKLEKNIEKLIYFFEKNTRLKIHNKLKGAYLRSLYISALNSKNLLKLHKDYYTNNIKNDYYFPEYEIFLLAKFFVKSLM